MSKHPFLMATLVAGTIFLVFLVVVVTLSRSTGRSGGFAFGEKVGVVEVCGVIANSRKINEQLIEFREDPSIKAIVLRVDSPGGGVGPSQEIHREVVRTVAVKPVVVSMGSVAASGGYYIAAPANRIVANAGTITGSIGVIMEFTNLQGLLEKIGLSSQVVKSGEYKDIGSAVRPMTDADRSVLQGLIDDVHQQFVAAVAEGRGVEMEKAKTLADGRVYTGSQAMALGLVDQLGNLQDAIALAGELAGTTAPPKVVYPPKERTGLIDYLLQETVSRLHRGLEERAAPGLEFIWTGN